MSCIRQELITITPEMAEQFLQKNNANVRSINETKVAQWVTAIKSGNWELTHQGLAFSKSGILIDGQHRLSAIKKSGMPVPMWIAYYDSDDISEINKSIDCGLKRNLSTLTNLSNTIVKVLNIFIRDFSSNKTFISPEMKLIMFYNSLSDFDKKLLSKLEKYSLMSAIILSGCYAYIKNNPDNAKECFETLDLLNSHKHDKFSNFTSKASNIYSYFETHRKNQHSDRVNGTVYVYAVLSGYKRVQSDTASHICEKIYETVALNNTAILKLAK